MDGTEKKAYDIFSDKESALDMSYSLLSLVEALAQRHGFPLVATIEQDGWLRTFHHFPENTGSELRAAWYEIAGLEDEQ